MKRFECDYAEGCHPQVMARLVETNLEQSIGYGEDEHCEKARALVRAAIASPDADVHFLVGGTQANATVITAALRPHQGVLCADTGHINVHETGAIEATGHKVLPLPSRDGKITAEQIRDYVEAHWADETHEHIVQPAMLYISNPTELGSLYHKAELEAIAAVCREKELILYVDGARMGYGLAAADNDLSLADYARLCDAFTLGGTKVGALFGEAVILANPALKRDFRYIIKRGGGMLAKGRLLGVQFRALLEDGLYDRISRHAVQQAMRIREALLAKGYRLVADSPTNQQFIAMPEEHVKALETRYAFSHGASLPNGERVVRFCTSWATREEDVDALLADLAKL